MFLTTKTKVIIDTNFLLIPGDCAVDIFSEITKIMQEPFELCVLDRTVEELEKLIQKKGKKKEGFSAKLGLILLKQKNLKILSSSSGEYADKAIIAFAKNNPKKVVVATQDRDLKNKLKELSVRVIELRQGNYLVLG